MTKRRSFKKLEKCLVIEMENIQTTDLMDSVCRMERLTTFRHMWTEFARKLDNSRTAVNIAHVATMPTTAP